MLKHLLAIWIIIYPCRLLAESPLEPPNRPPQIRHTYENMRISEGVNRSYTLQDSFFDPDGQPLSFTAHSSTPEVAIVGLAASGFYVSAQKAGQSLITLTASDGLLGAENVFFLTVEANAAPIVIKPIENLVLYRDSGTVLIDLSRVFADPDSSKLAFAYEKNDDDNDNIRMISTAELLVTPGILGSLSVVAIASDAQGRSVSEPFTITVLDEQGQ